MNRILFEEKADRYELDPSDPRFEHVRGVLRMRKGDSFDAGVVNGPVGRACIECLTTRSMTVRVEWGPSPPPPAPIWLLLGMCRPAAARRILGTVPTLGARGLIVVPAGKSDPAYARSALWRDGAYRRYLKEGAEQAFDTWVPSVHLPASLTEAMERVPREARRLALDVYEGSTPLSTALGEPPPAVCLAVGPERGWNHADRQALLDNGFDLVRLNDRVLRVETAVVVGMTLLLQQLGAYS